MKPLSGSPQIAAAFRRAIEGRLNARDPHGAGRLLAPLSLLALGQNTGLHPGETKYGSEEFASSPFGGEPLKGVTEEHIENADLASGNVRLSYTRTPDKDSMRELTTKITNQLAAAAGLPWDGTKLKQLDVAFESRMELEVGDGITRTVHDEETTNIGLPGYTSSSAAELT